MKLKKIEHTKQGYSYIKCTRQECFEWGGAAICDMCGKDMLDDVYLIYILSSAYCPKCFDDWIKHSKRYEEDIELQKRNDKRYYFNYGFKII